MPSSRLQEFIDRLVAVEKAVAVVYSDIKWIKWLLGGIGTVGLLILGVLLHK